MNRKPSTYKKQMKRPKVSKPVKEYVKDTIKSTKETNYNDVLYYGGPEFNYDNIILVPFTSGISQGDTVQSRSGDMIEPVSLTGQGHIITSNTYSTVCRIIIFQWKPDNAVDVPSFIKLMAESPSTASVNANFVGEKTARSKFKVLYDRRFGQPDGISTLPSTIMFNFNIRKFANKYINYNASSTQGKSQLYMLAYSNVPVASAGPNLWLRARLNYKDNN